MILKIGPRIRYKNYSQCAETRLPQNVDNFAADFHDFHQKRDSSALLSRFVIVASVASISNSRLPIQKAQTPSKEDEDIYSEAKIKPRQLPTESVPFYQF